MSNKLAYPNRLRPIPLVAPIRSPRLGPRYPVGPGVSLGQAPDGWFDREDVAEIVEAIDIVLEAYRRGKFTTCTAWLEREGPENIAEKGDILKEWLLVAAPERRWPADRSELQMASVMIPCARVLREIIPGVPNAVTYIGGLGVLGVLGWVAFY